MHTPYPIVFTQFFLASLPHHHTKQSLPSSCGKGYFDSAFLSRLPPKTARLSGHAKWRRIFSPSVSLIPANPFRHRLLSHFFLSGSCILPPDYPIPCTMSAHNEEREFAAGRVRSCEHRCAWEKTSLRTDAQHAGNLGRQSFRRIECRGKGTNHWSAHLRRPAPAMHRSDWVATIFPQIPNSILCVVYSPALGCERLRSASFWRRCSSFHLPNPNREGHIADQIEEVVWVRRLA